MEKSRYKQQIEAIANGIEIHTVNRFTILGKQEFVKHQMPYQNYAKDLNSFGDNSGIDIHQQKQNLIQTLTHSIYSQFYCGIAAEDLSEKLPVKSARDIFMEELSHVNTTPEKPDYNWTIYSIDQTGNAFVKKGEELRWLQPNGYQFQDPNQKECKVNTKVNLIKPKENKDLQPVFYHVFSEEIFPQEAEMARIYWNIHPEGAAELIAHLTKTLNAYKIPFQFKCLNHPELFVRTDAAVLYLDKKHVPIVSIILKPVIDGVRNYLKEEVPMFTLPIAKGVGYAEDPGRGMSFGMSRATAIAEALADAFFRKANTKEKIDTVIDHLERKGMVIDRLHLNKHTVLTPNFPSYE